MDDNELTKTLTAFVKDLRTAFILEVSELGDMIFGELKQESSEFTTRTAIPTKQVKEEVLRNLSVSKKDDVIAFDIQNTFNDESAIAHVTGKKKKILLHFQVTIH